MLSSREDSGTFRWQGLDEYYCLVCRYAKEVVERKFGGMLNAFRYGAPPHGGTAPGVDRIVMLTAGEENLHEVTMFPMNQKAEDLMMMGAPSEPLPRQLREANIRVVLPEAAKG